MSKLTEKDLMIGDWIMFPNSIEKIQEVAYVEGKGYCASFAASATLFPIPIDKLEPIPLTKEILEKNFPIQNPQITSKWVKWWDFEDENGFYFEIDTPDNECDGPILNMDFKYVHQLQHALKLCGTEKEIEL